MFIADLSELYSHASLLSSKILHTHDSANKIHNFYCSTRLSTADKTNFQNIMTVTSQICLSGIVIHSQKFRLSK